MSISLRGGPPKTAFTQYMLSSKLGDTLYTNLSDAQVTNIATRYSLGVKTKRIIGIHPRTKEVTDLTSVTIISLA